MTESKSTSEIARVPQSESPPTRCMYIYIYLPLVQIQTLPSGPSYHWGILFGVQRKKLICPKWFSGLQRNKLP